MEPSEPQISLEEAILQAQNASRAALNECEESMTAPCQMLEYLWSEKMEQFGSLTLADNVKSEGTPKMDLGDLKAIDKQTVEMSLDKDGNPQCKLWDTSSHTKMIDLFDLDGDKMLNFFEWLPMEMVLMMTDLISKPNEKTGCPEFQA